MTSQYQTDSIKLAHISAPTATYFRTKPQLSQYPKQKGLDFQEFSYGGIKTESNPKRPTNVYNSNNNNFTHKFSQLRIRIENSLKPYTRNPRCPRIFRRI